jgi:hypothetical protein
MPDDDDATLEDVQVHVAALGYYLYRLAGCPLGDSLSGYQAWLQISTIEPFNQLSEAAEA